MLFKMMREHESRSRPRADRPEQRVAHDLGLNTRLPLEEACADFYLLEQVWRETHGWNGDVRFGRGVFPDSFGRGGREEIRAYSADRMMHELETYVANQLMTYIVFATGGEARYWANVSHQVVKVRKRDGKMYAADGTGKDRLGGAVRRYFDGQGISPMAYQDAASMLTAQQHRPVAWTSWFHTAKDYELGMGTAMRELGQMFRSLAWYIAGNWSAYSCDQTLRFRDGKHRVEARPGWIVDRNDKLLGLWNVNPIHGPEDPSTLEKLELRDFGLSIGGNSWAKPCFIAADYLDGRITARTFIDRCWSIQHNGGSLFNKVWPTRDLQRVLVRQAQDDYGYLASIADPEVRRLWVEHVWKPGEPWPVKGPKKKVSKDVERPAEYCKACWLEFTVGSGAEDPCSHSYECAYADKYGLHEVEYEVYEEEEEEDIVEWQYPHDSNGNWAELCTCEECQPYEAAQACMCSYCEDYIQYVDELDEQIQTKVKEAVKSTEEAAIDTLMTQWKAATTISEKAIVAEAYKAIDKDKVERSA